MIAAIAACIPIVTGMFALDARYVKVEDADARYEALVAASDEKHYHQDVDREEGDLQTKLRIINNRLDFLRDKDVKTPDELDEIEYLKKEREIIMERLQELKEV